MANHGLILSDGFKTEGKRNIIHQLLEEYDIQSAVDLYLKLTQF